MKKVTQWCLLALFTGILALTSCKKEDIAQTETTKAQIEQLLQLPTEAGPALQATAANLRTQLQHHDFSAEFLRLHGQPLWEKAIKKGKTADRYMLYVPTRLPQQNSISSFFTVSYQNGQFTYRLYPRAAMATGLYARPAWWVELWLAKLEAKALGKKGIRLQQLSPSALVNARQASGHAKGHFFGLVNPDVKHKEATETTSMASSGFVILGEGDDCCIEIWENPDGDPSNNNGDEFYLRDDCSACEDEVEDELVDGVGGGNGCPWYNPLCNAGNGGGGATQYSLEFGSFYQTLNASQQAFLDNQEFSEYYHGFIDYLILHQFSQEAKDKIIWSIDYLTSPSTVTTTFQDFKSNYLNDFPSLSFLSQDDVNWIGNYPYLQSRIYYYLQQPNLLNKEAKVQFHINKLRTDMEYFSFNIDYSANNQYKNLWFKEDAFLYNLGGTPFGEWAVDYLMQHPTESFNNLYYSHLTEVENNLINPCLKGLVNAITKGKHRSIVFDLFKKLQTDAKFPIKFTYEEVGSLPNDAPAKTQDGYSPASPNTISAGIMIVQLNTSVLIGKSKEYISSVILHEIAHAIEKAKAVMASFPALPQIPTQAAEHTAIIEAKLSLTIYQSLIDLFPSANVQEMKELAIGGFADVLFSPNGTLLSNNLTQLITAADFFPGIDISNAYNNTIPEYKDATKGTICN